MGIVIFKIKNKLKFFSKYYIDVERCRFFLLFFQSILLNKGIIYDNKLNAFFRPIKTYQLSCFIEDFGYEAVAHYPAVPEGNGTTKKPVAEGKLPPDPRYGSPVRDQVRPPEGHRICDLSSYQGSGRNCQRALIRFLDLHLHLLLFADMAGRSFFGQALF